jgi:CRP-like cAMP-binding protein
MAEIDPHSLQCHSLFGGLSDKEMAVIIPYLQEDHFDSEHDIIIEGDTGDRVYFIRQGTVDILKEHKNEDGTIELRKLAELHAGDTFGEMELIDIQCRTATVRTTTPVETLSLSNKDLYDIYHKELKIFTMLIMNLARDISRRLRKMDDLFTDIMTRNHIRYKAEASDSK